jgi:hypothetical protein
VRQTSEGDVEMNEDRIVELLAEIRDLQQRHFETYQTAVRNQEESIRAQKEAIAFQKTTTRRLMFVLVPVVSIALGLILWLLLVSR